MPAGSRAAGCTTTVKALEALEVVSASVAVAVTL
jgi:hypothetical protein